jgi:hypothetical protein
VIGVHSRHISIQSVTGLVVVHQVRHMGDSRNGVKTTGRFGKMNWLRAILTPTQVKHRGFRRQLHPTTQHVCWPVRNHWQVQTQRTHCLAAYQQTDTLNISIIIARGSSQAHCALHYTTLHKVHTPNYSLPLSTTHTAAAAHLDVEGDES